MAETAEASILGEAASGILVASTPLPDPVASKPPPNPEVSEYLTAEDILTQDDLPTEDLTIPEWGNRKVTVRTLTAKERDDFEASMIQTRGKGKNQTRELKMDNVRALLAVKVLVDPITGERIFSDSEAGKLGAKNGKAINRIWELASKLSGISDEDVEELVGNSEADQSGSSSSS